MEKAISAISAIDRGNEEVSQWNFDIGQFDRSLKIRSEQFWRTAGERKALQLFHAVAARVPAYKDFLKKAGIKHDSIRTIRDFANVPMTDAKNYVAAYPLKARCWDGDIASVQFASTSSGTTGEPKFWPRSMRQDFEAAAVHQWLYRLYFKANTRRTLIVIGFPMGIYVSGMATFLPTWLASLREPTLAVMSVGNNKVEILKTVKNLSHLYEQTILIGHPFFIKDVIEEGIAEGIDWKEKNLGLMFCSGDITESWRAYVAKKAGIPPSAIRIFSTYGSSEFLLMAYESEFTIKAKARFEKDKKFLGTVTGSKVPPQLFQYNPLLRYAESVDGELVFTVASGIPLVRFNMHDRGMVLPLSSFSKLGSKPTYQLPVIALWGRSDDTVKFHGANIYVDHVKNGLGHKKYIKALTGKFFMRKYLGNDMNEVFEVNVELAPSTPKNKKLEEELRAQLTRRLRAINMEYLDMSSHVDLDTRPQVVAWPYQHEKYFKPGLKPRYIEKI